MTSEDLPNHQACFGCVENVIQRHKGIITLIVILLIVIGTGLLQYKLISNLGSEHDVLARSVVCDGKFLKEGLTNWLTLLCVMCSFFGLIVPAGAYLLQLKTLREEKKEIFEKLMKIQNKDHEELKEKLNKDYERTRVEIETSAARIWSAFGSGLEWQVVENLKRVSNAQELANYIIGFDHTLEAIARSKDGARLCDFITKIQPHIQQFMTQELWAETVKLLSQTYRKDDRFLRGADYKDLVGGRTNQYLFLKKLFDQYAPWKFGDE